MLRKIFTNRVTQSIVKVAVFPLYASKLLLAHFNANKHLDEISKNIDSYGSRHEVPGRDYPQIGEKIPAYLLDTKGDWILASDGTPLTSKFLENELHTGYVSPAVPLYMLVGAMLVSLNIVFSALNLQTFSLGLLAIYSFFFVRMLGFGTFFWFALTAFPFAIISQLSSFPFIGQLLGETKGVMEKAPFIVALLPALFIYFNTRNYLKNYYATMANDSLKHVSSYKAEINQARLTQAINAINDDSAEFDFGKCLGVAASKGDPFGPDKGQPFVVKHRDLRTNILSQGKTQTGKTYGNLLPIGHFIANNVVPGEAPDGFIVSCGKRTLPIAFVGAGLIKNNHRIHPDFMDLNWIHEMAERPDYISNEIAKAVQGKNVKNDHWTLSARIAFECSLTIHRALIMTGHGDTTQASYFQTVRDVQLSMSEAENIDNTDKAVAEKIKPLMQQKILLPVEAIDEIAKIDEKIKAIKAEEALKRATESKNSLIAKLIGHDDLINEQSMLYRAVTNYNMIFQKTPEERSGVFSTLAAWIDMFTANEKLNRWSFVPANKSQLNLRKLVREGSKFNIDDGRWSIELSEDEFSTAGPVLTKLIFKFFTTYVLEERTIDRNTDYPYMHIFMDEAHQIADENLAGNMSLLLSKRVSYIVAFQMDESIIDRFGENFLNTMVDNCHIQIAFDTSAKTLERWSNSAGYIYRKKRVVNQSTTDVVATVQNKASSEWLNLNSENRSYLNKMFRYVHKDYVRGFIPTSHNLMMRKNGSVVKGLLSNYQNIVSVKNSEQQEPIFTKTDFTTHFAHPLTCAIRAKVSGVARRDLISVQPMNNQGQRVDVSAQRKIQDYVEKEAA